MNYRYIQLIVVKIGLLGLMLLSVSANPLRSSNHGFNPALLGIRSRPFVEFYNSADIGVANSYFSIGNLFSEELLLDFNHINKRLFGKNLGVGSHFSLNTHLAADFLGVSAGYYLGLNGLVRAGIPRELVRLLAEGNQIDTTSSGTGDTMARLFMEMGAYGGYRWEDFQFGAKLGVFAPIMYSDSNSNLSYHFTTDSETGSINAGLDLNVPFYSVIDFERLDNDASYNPLGDVFGNMNGIDLSLGAIKVVDGKAMYGASITGLTIKASRPGNELLLTAGMDVEITNIIEGNEPELVENEPDVSFVSDSDRKVRTPLSIGGFYRFVGYPDFVDWIGHGGLTFDGGRPYLSLGVTAEGAVFPLSILSLGIEYDRILWRTTLGVRGDFRAAEIGLDLGLAAPQMIRMWSASGLYGKLYLAFGF